MQRRTLARVTMAICMITMLAVEASSRRPSSSRTRPGKRAREAETPPPTEIACVVGKVEVKIPLQLNSACTGFRGLYENRKKGRPYDQFVPKPEEPQQPLCKDADFHASDRQKNIVEAVHHSLCGIPALMYGPGDNPVYLDMNLEIQEMGFERDNVVGHDGNKVILEDPRQVWFLVERDDDYFWYKPPTEERNDATYLSGSDPSIFPFDPLYVRQNVFVSEDLLTITEKVCPDPDNFLNFALNLAKNNEVARFLEEEGGEMFGDNTANDDQNTFIATDATRCCNWAGSSKNCKCRSSCRDVWMERCVSPKKVRDRKGLKRAPSRKKRRDGVVDQETTAKGWPYRDQTRTFVPTKMTGPHTQTDDVAALGLHVVCQEPGKKPKNFCGLLPGSALVNGLPPCVRKKPDPGDPNEKNVPEGCKCKPDAVDWDKTAGQTSGSEQYSRMFKVMPGTCIALT